MANPVTRDELLFRTMQDGRTYRASTLNKRVGWRFGASIFNLRALGCDIESYRGKDGEWRYTMFDGNAFFEKMAA